MQILTIKYVAMTVASLAFLMGCSPNQHDSVSLDSESEAAKPQSIAKFKAYTKRCFSPIGKTAAKPRSN